MPAQTIEELRQHETRRWTYMRSDQLLTRLGRIRNPNKLACFISMASGVQGRSNILERRAWRRAVELNLTSQIRGVLQRHGMTYDTQVMESELRLERVPSSRPLTVHGPDAAFSERSERLRREALNRNHAAQVEQARPAVDDAHPALADYGDVDRIDGVPERVQRERIDAQTHTYLGNFDDPDIKPEPDIEPAPEPKKKVKRRVIRFKRKARQLQLKSILNDD